METLIISLFVGVGIFGAFYSVWSIVKTLAAKNWPVVDGQIISNDMNERRDNDGDYMYEAKLTYKYSFNRRAHKGKRIAFGFGSWNVKSFVYNAYGDAIENYPDVRVHVNPKSPTQSTVLVGIRNFHIGNIFFFSVWNTAMYFAFSN